MIEEIDLWIGSPLPDGSRPFYATATVAAPSSAGRASIERKVSDLLASLHAVLPPVQHWRVKPEVNSSGDFETNQAVAVARSRGWFEP